MAAGRYPLSTSSLHLTFVRCILYCVQTPLSVDDGSPPFDAVQPEAAEIPGAVQVRQRWGGTHNECVLTHIQFGAWGLSNYPLLPPLFSPLFLSFPILSQLFPHTALWRRWLTYLPSWLCCGLTWSTSRQWSEWLTPAITQTCHRLYHVAVEARNQRLCNAISWWKWHCHVCDMWQYLRKGTTWGQISILSLHMAWKYSWWASSCTLLRFASQFSFRDTLAQSAELRTFSFQENGI